ncbi:hypothetical protein HXX76_013316 [Chlamydomonas incerta]|uniref:PPPDE domain-containing protein n=1 Tax=Chlamydomonas incerta TaxID=51695 RepID=A0A835SM04_CHLIN|nr:hypothetical protein HXX76_013316 [Chlamydomonas incerta]|eukprot:KAG2425943.1 hypothetical protein HXX76_013316 [Chlamydomonas incerta]
MYNFRETVELGVTEKSKQEIKEIMSRLKRAWAGISYDLLQRNCCHFCEELCAELGVPPPPAWLNRFAQGADATVKLTNEASALAKRVSANLSQTATVSANWLREMSARVMAQMTLSEEDGLDGSPRPYETLGSSSSPGGLSMHSMPPPPPSGGSAVGAGGNGSNVDLSTRSEPVGLGGRIAGRLRALAPSGTGAGDAGSNGLPASTAAAAGPGGDASAGGSFAASASSGSSSGLAALKQKWQELEASAGDGTKQFLFGLIKTRQARLDEDDPGFPAPSSSAASSQADLSSRGLLHNSRDNAASTGAGVAAGAVPPAQSMQDGARPGAAAQGVALPPPTQPPLQQVISHTLLPADVVGASTTHAPAASTAATGTGSAAVAPAQSSGHLLDM